MFTMQKVIELALYTFNVMQEKDLYNLGSSTQDIHLAIQ